MSVTELLQSIAAQLARGTEVGVGGETLPASRTSTRLKSLRFETNARAYQAIEQNPRKILLGQKLARDDAMQDCLHPAHAAAFSSSLRFHFPRSAPAS